MIYDVKDKLQKHKFLTWRKRDLFYLDRIIFHQSASEASIEQINKYHISKNNHISKLGCPKIAYHIVIDFNGDIYFCNDFTEITWHCKNENYRSIGVCILGKFPGSIFSDLQKESVKYIIMKYSELKVYGHCDFNKPTCPGKEINQYIQRWKV